MARDLREYYSKILKIAASGKLGKVQVCIFSENVLLSAEDTEERIGEELLFAEKILNQKQIREYRDFSNEPYRHGTIAREYDGGAIVRYTYTAAPMKESVFITLYGSDGELRFDGESGKITTYIQSPDYPGDVSM